METSCKERVGAAYHSRFADIRKLWELYKKDPELSDEDCGKWDEYGLSFDYVAPDTFKNQRRGYFRYQISYGGPSEEIRTHCDENFNMTRAEFWFLDWFDGAKRNVTGKNLETWKEIWEDFRDVGLLEYEHKKATED